MYLQLGRFRIRVQLLIALGLPLLLAATLLVQRVLGHRASVDRIEDSVETLELVASVHDLVFHLQVERGASAGYSANGAFENLQSLRRTVDDAYDVVLAKSAAARRDGVFQTGIVPLALEEQRARIDVLRQEVDASTGAFLPLFEAYGFEIDRLIEACLTWSSASADPWVAERAPLLHLLQRLQELAGRVRGVLSGVLAAGTLEQQVAQELRTWIRDEELLATELAQSRLADWLDGPVLQHARDQRYLDLRGRLLRAAEKSEARKQLDRALGYLGMIHQFKNYVLRGDPSYRANFLASAARADDAIRRYRALDISPEEEQALQVLADTVSAYRSRLVVADSLLAQGAGPDRIDAAVRVDDEPGRLALLDLDRAFRFVEPEGWFALASERVDHLSSMSRRLIAELDAHHRDQLQRARLAFRAQLAALLLVAGAIALVAFAVSRGLTRRLEQLTEAVEEVERSGSLDRLRVPVGGSDEVRALAEAFGRMGTEIERRRTALQKLNVELEQRIEERTSDLGEALAELEDRRSALEDVLDGATSLIHSVDPQGRLLYVNRAWLDTFELTEEEALGQSIFDRVHPDSLQEGLEVFERHAREQKVQEVDAWFVSGSGRRLRLAGRVEPVIRDGEFVFTRTYLRDLTTEQELREDLRRQEDLLHQFASASRQVFWIYDDRGQRFVYVNEAFHDLAGRPADDLLTNPSAFFDLFPAEEHPHIRALIDRARAGEFVEADHRLVATDGTEKWIRLRTYPLRGTDGEVDKIAGISEDVSQRKELELQVAASERRLRAREEVLQQFVRSTPAAVAMFDADMRYLAASDRWRIETELGDVELIGQRLWDLPRHVPEEWRQVTKRCLSGKSAQGEETAFQRSDGRLDWLRWDIQPWRRGTGQVGGLLVFSEIVTEAKRARDSLRRRALVDSLTGISNREAFQNDLARLWQRYERSGGSFTLFYLDLDGFKPVNDRHGHGAGDDVLAEVAARLRNTSRPGDPVARLGGDEFALVAPQLSDREAAVRLARRLAEAIARPVDTRAGEVTVRASIGIAWPEEVASLSELLDLVDQRMYATKQGGRAEESA